MTFGQGRGQITLIDSKRLKSGLKELEELLVEQSVIFSSWRTSSLFQLVLSSGLIVNVHLNKMGDLSKITYDKYLSGKLLDYITDFAFTSKMVVVTYLESRVTLIASIIAIKGNAIASRISVVVKFTVRGNPVARSLAFTSAISSFSRG